MEYKHLDEVLRFINERCETSAEGRRVRTVELYRAFCQWRGAKHYVPLNAFGRALALSGVRAYVHNGYRTYALRVR